MLFHAVSPGVFSRSWNRIYIIEIPTTQYLGNVQVERRIKCVCNQVVLAKAACARAWFQGVLYPIGPEARPALSMRV